MADEQIDVPTPPAGSINPVALPVDRDEPARTPPPRPEPAPSVQADDGKPVPPDAESP